MIALLLTIYSAFAEDPFIRLSDDSLYRANNNFSDEYLSPNERYPQDALRAFESAPEGVYISVGTERGFIGAAIAARVTHVLLIDVNPKIVIQNRLNILLLRLSKNRQDYLALRQSQSADLWMARADEVELNPNEREFMKNNFQKWRQYFWRTDALDHLSGREFKGANYLFDDAQYFHLKQMADAGYIVAAHADLSDDARMEEIVKELDRVKVSLSVLDLSNAWQGAYLKERAVARMLATLNSVAQGKSILIQTNNYPMIAHFFGDRWLWTYSAYTFEKLRRLNSWTKVVRAFYRDRIPPFLWRLRVFGWTLSRESCQSKFGATLAIQTKHQGQ